MKHKIIIVGAGIAGSLLAITLKKIGFDVVIYEARKKDDLGGGVFLGLTPNGLNVLKNFESIFVKARLYESLHGLFTIAGEKNSGLFNRLPERAIWRRNNSSKAVEVISAR